MTATKPILQQFLVWLETAYGHPDQGATSEFSVEPPPETLVMAEIAMGAALTGDRVVLGTSVPVKTIVGALVLRRAGVTLEEVYQGNFTDAQFDALADTLRAVKGSGLVIDWPDDQPGSNFNV